MRHHRTLPYERTWTVAHRGAAASSIGRDAERATGFTHQRLVEAFALVTPRDWRGPVRAEISAADRWVVEEAIIWFTATIPIFLAIPGYPDRLTVAATGYRPGPAGL